VKIFVSYSHFDANDFAYCAKNLCERLTHEVFMDVESIEMGEEWSNKIKKEIQSSNMFIIIVTPMALSSIEIEKEVNEAKNSNVKILPCFYRSVLKNHKPWGLEKIQGLEFENKDELVRKLSSILLNRSDFVVKKIDPKNFISFLDNGRFLNKKGKYLEAIQCFDQAIEIDPKNAIAWFEKGFSLAKAGKYLEAIQCFDQAIEIDPKNAIAWDNKGYSEISKRQKNLI
jgi:tetratricopeptide (TPR) repeat protein